MTERVAAAALVLLVAAFVGALSAIPIFGTTVPVLIVGCIAALAIVCALTWAVVEALWAS